MKTTFALHSPLLDDVPTSPAAIDNAPPTESSLPMMVPTPPPVAAANAAALAKDEHDAPREKAPRRGARLSKDKLRQDAERMLARTREALGKAGKSARAGSAQAAVWLRARAARLDPAPGTKRPPWVLPAFAGGGLVVGIGLVALIASASRHSASGEAAPSAGAADPAGSASAAPSPGAPTPPAILPPPHPIPMVECSLAGERHVLAPKAVLAAGVEVRALGDSLAIGFATAERQGAAVRVDPDTLSATKTVAAPAKVPIKRVTPIVSGKDGLGAVVDVDRPGDTLHGRRTVTEDPPLQLGNTADGVRWAKVNGPPAGKLWDLDGDGDVEAARGDSTGSGSDRPTAIVFRRGNAVYAGVATGQDALTAQGSLSRMAGLGPAVGSPAVAQQDGIVIVAWSDRPSSDDPWRIRWVRFKAGEAPGEPVTFTPPAGGRGEQTMSPSVVAVPGKRFLLLWTEGPQARHDVRALTLGEDGAPIGNPLMVSAEGANAGQAQAAIKGDGHGVVAFLESTEDGFEVAGSPIVCPQP